MDKVKIASMVDDIVKWDRLMKEGKKIIDELKGKLQKEALELMEQDHAKQIVFNGEAGNRVVVTETETVDLVYYSILANVFGGSIGDVVDKNISYKLKPKFKELANGIFNGEYGTKTKDEIISDITSDGKSQKLLGKKLKGNPKKDADVLEAVIGFDRSECMELAGEVAAAVTYEKMLAMAQVAGKSLEELVSGIKNALIVDEGIKIGIEYEAEIIAHQGDNTAA